MKLHEVLSVISGSTKITIYVGCINVFSGKMADIAKKKWDEDVGMYLDCEVIRLNVVDKAITIAV